MSEVFKDIKRLYLDTAPLIYYIEANPNFLAKTKMIMTLIEEQPIEAFSSVITLTEVLNYPNKQGNTQVANEYRDILLNNENFQVVAVRAKIAEGHRHRRRGPAANIRGISPGGQ